MDQIILIAQDIYDSEKEAFGMVGNTIEELEPEYVEECIKVRGGKKLWCIGPVSLCNREDSDKAERGNKASIDQQYQRMKWLDSHESSSIIYVCLGSLSFMYGQEEDVGVVVKRDDIKIAIDKLMDGGEEGEERRERARKLGEIAKGAVEEGSSSYNNITRLIQEVIMQQKCQAAWGPICK